MGDRYRVVRLLGQGGMGRVYEAQHVYLARRVALKLLRRDREAQPEALARFQQEAYAASKIGHPSIVEVADFAVMADGRVYLAMEYLDGETLEDWMNRGGELLPALGWVAQAARGLAAAHAAGVVHRDVKPGNIFLARGADGIQVKLLDFGIAKLMAQSESRVETRVGNILGTPYYLAPERALGRALDPRADLYSLGVVLYELLTGNVPFLDPTFAGVLGKHVRAAPLDPRQAAPDRGIPDGIAELTMAMLAKDPAARPGSATDVALALEELVARERADLGGIRVQMQPVGGMSASTFVMDEPVPLPSTTVPVAPVSDPAVAASRRWASAMPIALVVGLVAVVAWGLALAAGMGDRSDGSGPAPGGTTAAGTAVGSALPRQDEPTPGPHVARSPADVGGTPAGAGGGMDPPGPESPWADSDGVPPTAPRPEERAIVDGPRRGDRPRRATQRAEGSPTKGSPAKAPAPPKAPPSVPKLKDDVY